MCFFRCGYLYPGDNTQPGMLSGSHYENGVFRTVVVCDSDDLQTETRNFDNIIDSVDLGWVIWTVPSGGGPIPDGEQTNPRTGRI